MNLENRRCTFLPSRTDCAVAIVVIALNTAAVQRAGAEDHLDFKYMWYQEDNNRMNISTPSFLLETDLSPTLTLKIQGVYDAISGVSPTGAPPVKNITNVASTPSVSAQSSANVSVPVVYSPVPASTPAPAASIPIQSYYFNGENDRSIERGIRFSNGKSLRLAPQGLLGFHAKSGASSIVIPSRPVFVAPAPVFSAPAPVVSTPAPVVSTPTQTSSSAGGGQTTPTQQPATTPAATPQSQTPAPQNTKSSNTSTLPMAAVHDQREAVNISLTKVIEDHAVTGGFAFSTERDYESTAGSVNDAISFNAKQTTLSLGVAVTHDSVENFEKNKQWDSKDTVDGFVGLTQIIDPDTLFNVSVTLSGESGYLSDQYKVVLMNDSIIHEKRPDTKQKADALFSLTHMFKDLDGTAEVSCRLYDDSFGVRGQTFELDWYQKLSDDLILRPMVRYYQQTAANFYDVSFTGSPQYYSSDYRLAALQSIAYGIGLIWKPATDWSLDAGVERYDMSGRDNKTDAQAFPKATIVSAGVRWWF